MQKPIRPPKKCKGRVHLDEFQLVMEGSALALLAFAHLTLDLVGFSLRLPGMVIDSVAAHVGGVFCLGRKPSAVKIAQRLGGMSHDRLQRLLYEGRWTAPAISRALVRLVNMLGGAGYLVLDDTHLPRPRARRVEGVYWDYDSSTGKNVLGYRLVLLVWVWRGWTVPIAWVLWKKKGTTPHFRTKNDLARLLLRWSVRRLPKVRYVAFDAWYANAQMFGLCGRLGLTWVTRIRSTMRLRWKGLGRTARDLGAHLLAGSDQELVWPVPESVARKCVVGRGAVDRLAFVALKDEHNGDPDGVRYLLSSSPDLTARQVVERYKTRWAIEVLFRTLKQHFWLNAYQGRTLRGQKTYVALAFVALICAQYWAQRTGSSPAEVKDWVSQLTLARDAQGASRLCLTSAIPASHIDDITALKPIVQRDLSRLVPLRRPPKGLPAA